MRHRRSISRLRLLDRLRRRLSDRPRRWHGDGNRLWRWRTDRLQRWRGDRLRRCWRRLAYILLSHDLVLMRVCRAEGDCIQTLGAIEDTDKAGRLLPIRALDEHTLAVRVARDGRAQVGLSCHLELVRIVPIERQLVPVYRPTTTTHAVGHRPE